MESEASSGEIEPIFEGSEIEQLVKSASAIGLVVSSLIRDRRPWVFSMGFEKWGGYLEYYFSEQLLEYPTAILAMLNYIERKLHFDWLQAWNNEADYAPEAY